MRAHLDGNLVGHGACWAENRILLAKHCCSKGLQNCRHAHVSDLNQGANFSFCKEDRQEETHLQGIHGGIIPPDVITNASVHLFQKIGGKFNLCMFEGAGWVRHDGSISKSDMMGSNSPI